MDNSKLEELKKLAQESIREAQDTNALNDVRVRFLGKKGEITSLLKSMKDLSAEEKPKFGQLVNALRQQVEEELQEHMTELQKKAREAKMAAETIDVTLPAKKMQYGHAHPNTKALEEVERIFIGMGYEVVEGKLAIADIMQAARDGKLEEVFGTGTAAVVSPVKELVWKGEHAYIGDGNIGPVTQKLYDTMTGMQWGKIPDTKGWIVPVEKKY